MATYNKVKINYLSRDFNNVKEDLINYLKSFYPEQWQDFHIASPGMAMIELNAYVADLLSYAIDKKYNELFRNGVKQRSAVYRMAKTFGFKVPGVRASTTICDISVELPATANGPNYSYAPLIRPGMQVKGGGQIFETVNQIDFASDFSEEGKANKIIEPILDSSQNLLKYKITKREIVKAGFTKLYKVEVENGDEKPFFQVILPETNVLEIIGVIVENGVGLNKTPTFTDFSDINKKFWEVDYLATDKVFVENNSAPSSSGIKSGSYITVNKRFEKEFLSDGSCQITFGGGVSDYESYDEYLSKLTDIKGCNVTTDLNTASLLLNPKSLGEMVQGNSTIFIKYRVGGGILSNIGQYTLQSTGNINAVILGSDPSINSAVISSIRANNPIPAIGGRGLPTVAEIQKHIAANFASQERCVTLQDYISRVYQLPGKFGSPFRVHGLVDDNKVILYILTLDSNGKLNDITTSEIKNNIVEYLTPYRMINDFVEINDGKIINLEVNVDILVESVYNSSEIKVNAINQIKDFLDINKWHMNETIYISQIIDILREIPGIINVVNIDFFNLEGGNYSSTISPQATGNRTYDVNTGVYTTKIEYVDNAIYGSELSMFEIKYPEKNIKVRIATNNDINNAI